mmetsp:Transcript_65557/g.200772  ORF Transcript_65557/g.200772 Transcript_65557/m.200772 type:complete len:263 (+) Transcript_65557:781-1569(+)
MVDVGTAFAQVLEGHVHAFVDRAAAYNALGVQLPPCRGERHTAPGVHVEDQLLRPRGLEPEVADRLGPDLPRAARALYEQVDHRGVGDPGLLHGPQHVGPGGAARRDRFDVCLQRVLWHEREVHHADPREVRDRPLVAGLRVGAAAGTVATRHGVLLLLLGCQYVGQVVSQPHEFLANRDVDRLCPALQDLVYGLQDLLLAIAAPGDGGQVQELVGVDPDEICLAAAEQVQDRVRADATHARQGELHGVGGVAGDARRSDPA